MKKIRIIIIGIIVAVLTMLDHASNAQGSRPAIKGITISGSEAIGVHQLLKEDKIK